jgi:hypothetical protein
VNPLHRRVSVDCPSELLLDQLVVEELSGSDHEAVMAHLGGCANCRARRDERLAALATFQDVALPLALAAVTSDTGHALANVRRKRRQQGLLRPALFLGALAAAVALIPVALHRDETTTVKGSRALRVFVLHHGNVREGGPGEQVVPGDSLRFGLSPTAAGRHAAIFSKDGQGQVSVYFPDPAQRPSPTAMAPAPTTEDGLLPYSIRLDAVLGTETLHLLLCEAPLELEPIRAQLLAAGSTAPDWTRLLPGTCTVESLVITKQADQ